MGKFMGAAGVSLPILAAALGMAIPAAGQTTMGYSTLDVSIFGGGQWFQLYQGKSSRVINYDEGGVFGFRVTEDPWNHVGIEETFDVGRNNLRATLMNDPNVYIYGIAGRNYNVALNGLYYFTPRESKWRPFLTVGPGITYYRTVNGSVQPPGGPLEMMHMKYGPALVYGGGVKFNGWRRVGLRIDVRDTYTRSPHYGLPSYPITTGSVYLPTGGTEHALSATLGITFHLRMHEQSAPAPPPAPAPAPAPPVVAAAPAPSVDINVGSIDGAHDVCPGEALQLRSNARVSNGTPTYQWMINGTPVSGATGSSLTVPTTNSGSDSITVQVSAGGTSKTSDAVSLRVKNYSRPTVQVNASATTLAAGQSEPVSATATGSECGDPVNLTYAASEGTWNGNTYDSTGVNFGPASGRAQTKVVHLTATATDKTGGTGTGTADITITSKPEARRLEDLVFPTNSSRVNNCAKRLLLEVLTPILRDDPNAKVVLIGHRDAAERGKGSAGLDKARVLNAAAVLSAGTGICPQLELGRVQGSWVGTNQASPAKPSFCGTSTDVKEKNGQAVVDSDSQAQFRRVEVWVIPGGASMPAGVTVTDLPASTVKALGCPK